MISGIQVQNNDNLSSFAKRIELAAVLYIAQQDTAYILSTYGPLISSVVVVLFIAFLRYSEKKVNGMYLFGLSSAKKFLQRTLVVFQSGAAVFLFKVSGELLPGSMNEAFELMAILQALTNLVAIIGTVTLIESFFSDEVAANN